MKNDLALTLITTILEVDMKGVVFVIDVEVTAGQVCLDPDCTFHTSQR